MAALRQFTLFTPPRMMEEGRQYSTPWPGGQRARASGLAGLGNDVSDVIGTIHSGAMDFIGAFTGSNAQKQSQQAALELQRLNQERLQASAVARSEAWSEAAPYLAIGGAVVVLGIAFIALKR